jgi:hypothetical protein
LAIGVALPFLFQETSYVTQAYVSWVERLRADQRTFSADVVGYKDLWLLLRTAAIPISREAYLVIQLCAACAVAMVCLAGKLRGWSSQRLAESVFVLGCCWMVLLGPATESSTYCFLAPVIAIAFAESDQPVWTRFWISAIFGVLLASQASRWFPGGRDFSDPLMPLGGLLLFADRLVRSVRSLKFSVILDDNEQNQTEHRVPRLRRRSGAAALP